MIDPVPGNGYDEGPLKEGVRRGQRAFHPNRSRKSPDICSRQPKPRSRHQHPSGREPGHSISQAESALPRSPGQGARADLARTPGVIHVVCELTAELPSTFADRWTAKR
jgi:hypothetical protein